MWLKVLGTTGAISAAVCGYHLKLLIKAGHIWDLPLSVCLVLVCSVMTLVAADMIRLGPADSHTPYTLLTQYMHLRYLTVIAKTKLHRFFKDIRRCRETQTDVLRHILSYNANTEYGRKHKFRCISTREEFRKSHPLTTYAHYSDYIDRMGNGESNILMKDPPLFVGMTSGTTGKNKEYPSNRTMKHLYKEVMDLALQQFSPYFCLKRVFQMRLFAPYRTNNAGVEKGGMSSFIFPLQPWNIIPDIITQIHQETPAFYVQALFCLTERDIYYVETISSNLCYSFFKFIETHWQKLCEDIKTGSIWDDVELDSKIRDQIQKCLHPNPSRAEQLRNEFRKGPDNLAKRLWPGLRFLWITRTGSFANCAQLLSNSFLKDVTFRGYVCGSTEAPSGVICMSGDGKAEEDIYTLFIHGTFFEFIPIADVFTDTPRTYFAEQLKAGELYEVVITSFQGLYRYRLGDVFEVVDAGHGNEAPTFRFKYRLGQILNLAFERTPENIIYKALTRAENQWQISNLVDYTATESFVLESILGGHHTSNYVIFVELSSQTKDTLLTGNHAKILDSILCEEHEPYLQFRVKGSISPLRLVQVKHGSFEGLRSVIVGGKPNIAFKMPRVIRKNEHVKYLLDHIV